MFLSYERRAMSPFLNATGHSRDSIRSCSEVIIESIRQSSTAHCDFAVGVVGYPQISAPS